MTKLKMNPDCEDCKAEEELCSDCLHEIRIKAVDENLKNNLLKAVKHDVLASSMLSPCYEITDTIERAKKLLDEIEDEVYKEIEDEQDNS